MPGIALSLGPVAFQDFEIPPSIAFGGKQRVAVHYLSSGQRVMEALGPDDATISFAGMLSGPSASQRARDIDALRSLGQSLILAWDAFSYPVIIASFQAEYRNQWWIPYRISCTVLSNPQGQELDVALPPTSEALAALNLAYSTVPRQFTPATDVRGMILSAASGVNTAGTLAAASVILYDATAGLALNQSRYESKATSLALNSGGSATEFAGEFATMVSATGALQSIALAQDCFRQASLLLSSASNP